MYNLSVSCELEFEAPLNATCSLIRAILIGDSSYSFASQISAKAEVASRKKMLLKEAATNLKSILTESLESTGASTGESWLTALPIREHGFALHKGAFRDALA